MTTSSTDLDKRTDELLADEAQRMGICSASWYRNGNGRDRPEWSLVRRLIEPPTDAKLKAIVAAWVRDEGPGGNLHFLRFAFGRRTAVPTPEPTIAEIAATLRAAGHEAMAVKVEGKS